jgi:hypothetical protein
MDTEQAVAKKRHVQGADGALGFGTIRHLDYGVCMPDIAMMVEDRTIVDRAQTLRSRPKLPAAISQTPTQQSIPHWGATLKTVPASGSTTSMVPIPGANLTPFLRRQNESKDSIARSGVLFVGRRRRLCRRRK